MTFFAALGFIEIAFILLFVLAMIFGTIRDRNDGPAFKWLVLVIGLVVAAAWNWSAWTFAGLGSVLISWAFWMPVLVYLGIGLGYAILEFVLEVRRSARIYKQKWIEAQHSNTRVDRFVNDQNHPNRIIKLEVNSETQLPEPRVDKSELSQSVGAWTIFWPFYFVSLVVGDLLVEIFNFFTDILSRISARFVKWSFGGVFK